MNLKVKSIRYFRTNRGIGYRAKTNRKGVEILNDGNGGATYLQGIGIGETAILYSYSHLTERQLESMLDTYEKSKGIIC